LKIIVSYPSVVIGASIGCGDPAGIVVLILVDLDGGGIPTSLKTEDEPRSGNHQIRHDQVDLNSVVYSERVIGFGADQVDGYVPPGVVTDNAKGVNIQVRDVSHILKERTLKPVDVPGISVRCPFFEGSAV
jgi:hypothetical protein